MKKIKTFVTFPFSTKGIFGQTIETRRLYSLFQVLKQNGTLWEV